MYKLINEITEAIELQEYIAEAVNEIFGEDAEGLYESAERYLGQAIAALNAGKNPFAGERPVVDPQIVASLALLSSPENRDAFNISPAKFAVLDHVDKSDKVRNFLTHKVATSQTGRNAVQRLLQTAGENPKAAARMLTQAQLAFKRADPTGDTSKLDQPSDVEMTQARKAAGAAAQQQGRLSNVPA